MTATLEQEPEYAEEFAFHEDGSFFFRFSDDLPSSFPGYDQFGYYATDSNLQSTLITVTISLLAPPADNTLGVRWLTFYNPSKNYIYDDNGVTRFDEKQWKDGNGDGEVALSPATNKAVGDKNDPILYSMTQKLKVSEAELSGILALDKFEKSKAVLVGKGSFDNQAGQ